MKREKRKIKERYNSYKKSQKGLSTIVATLLIILVTIVAVGILWVVIRNVIQNGSEQISLGKITLDLKISQIRVISYTDVNVTVKRNPGRGEFSGIVFVAYDSANSEMVRENISLNELEARNFQVTLSVVNTSKIKRISIAPVFTLKSGKQVVGDIKDVYEFTSKTLESPKCVPNCPTGAQCGSDGCLGGNCGLCTNPSFPVCSNYQCTQQTCIKNCPTGAQCGSDGCNGDCGTCPILSGTNSQCNSNYQCEIQSCIMGYDNCDLLVSNGCETDLNTNNSNCGTCGHICGNGETCIAGICSECTTSAECDDSNACTTDGCSAGTCSHTSISGCVSCSSNTQCEDNNACTTEICSGGKCQYTTLTCDDGNACTTNSCNALTGCAFTTMDCGDGLLCTQDLCNAGTCLHPHITDCCTSNLDCADGNACTTDTCGANNICVHTAITCNDNSQCTTDLCNALTGCQFTAVTCDDGNACTTNSCNALTGCAFTQMNCNDNDICTTDSCNAGTCLHPHITDCCVTASDCNDGSACTTDTCGANNVCIHTAITCNDNSLCTTDLCNGLTGCQFTTVTCNDADTCTTDSCNALTGCVFSPRTCASDNNVCTTDVGCVGGNCQYIPISCDDSNVCTTDSCDAITGCAHTAISGCGSGPTTYYVSTSGNNNYNGTDTGHPWQTLAYAESHATTPGDVIALKRGDTWSGSLSVHHGGNSAAPITWDGNLWGTGEKATISFLYDGVNNRGLAVVSIWGCKYVNFQNIIVNGNNYRALYSGIIVGGYPGIYPGSVQNDESDITIQDCDVKNIGDFANWSSGIHVNPWYTDISRITIRRNTVSRVDNHCIALYPGRIGVGAPDDYAIIDSYVGYNTVSKCGLLEDNVASGVLVAMDNRNNIIEHNTITYGGEGKANGVSLGGGLEGIEDKSTNLTIRYNNISSYWQGISIQDGMAITLNAYSNLIYQSISTSPAIWIQATGLGYSGASMNFYDNSIYVTGGQGFKNEATENGVSNFKNNIIYQTGTGQYAASLIGLTNAASTIHNNNLFWRTEQGDYLYVIAPTYTYKSSMLTWEPTAVIANPFLVSSTDYHLKNSSSPAIGKGITISGITTDYDGVSYRSPPSIGAYEFTGGASGGNIYYVNFTGGNDGWVGTSPSTAWKTISKINGRTFSAGDQILFARGETWRETLSVPSSGTAGNYITFGAYGVGNKPIFTGRQSISGWNTNTNWIETSTGSHIWYKSVSDSTRRLWLSNVEAKRAQSSSVTASLNFYDDGTSTRLYIYSTANPGNPGVFTNIEGVYTSNIVSGNQKSYVTFQNIDVGGSSLYTIDISGCSYWIIENCSIGRDSTFSGLVSDGRVGLTNNIIVRNNIFDTYDHNVDAYMHDNTFEGIGIWNGANNWEIYNNTFKDWTHAGIALRTVTDSAHPIINVKIHHNIFSAEDIDYGRAFNFEFYPVLGNSYGNEVYNNFMYSHGVHNLISGDGVKFYNNIIDGVRTTPYMDVSDPKNSECLNMQPYQGISNNNQIYNNIFMNCADAGIGVWGAVQEFKGNLIKNNIFYNNGLENGGYQIYYDDGDNYFYGNTFQNNSFYKSGTTKLIYDGKYFDTPFTVAEFNAKSGSSTNIQSGRSPDTILGNIAGDPLFVDVTNSNYLLRNYSLQPGSPAKWAGVNVGLLTDYAGVNYKNPPSIGAFEFTGTVSSGNTYYVNYSGGNDNNAGTSQAAAWKTIARVNRGTFSAGDQILFARGETWRDALIVPRSGTSSNYLTFGNYGSASLNKPKLYGSNVSTGWVSAGTNMWKSTSTFVNPSFNSGNGFDSEIFFELSNGSVFWGINKAGSLTGEYQWNWTLNYIYVYSPSGNPSSAYSSVEIPQRIYVINVGDTNEYIAIDGLDIRYSTSINVDDRDAPSSLTGFTIKNCRIAFVGSKLLGEGYALGVVRNNMLIQNNEIDDGGRRLISIHLYDTQSSTFSNFTIEGNNLYRGYHGSGIGINMDGSVSTTNIFQNIIVRNNIFYEDPERNPPVDGMDSTRQCTFRVEQPGGIIRNIQVYNNIFMYTNDRSLELNKVSNVTVYNNVFYDFAPHDNGVSGEGSIHLEIANACTAINVTNNIFYGSVSKTVVPLCHDVYLNNIAASQVKLNYNLFYEADSNINIINTGSNTYNRAAWAAMKTATGWQKNDTGIVDPLFVNPAIKDFNLQSNSKAIWNGTNVGLSTDYEGQAYHNPPSIGAFEYP